MEVLLGKVSLHLFYLDCVAYIPLLAEFVVGPIDCSLPTGYPAGDELCHPDGDHYH
jgi:hypothetical protein